MFEITTAPKEELLQDLADTLVDIKFCQLALIHGVETYFDGHASTRERLEINERIREKIHAELERREIAIQDR